MIVVLATRNAGKVAELRARLLSLPVQLIAADELENAPEVEEDAPTLRGNAETKARALFAHAKLPALADDTGLEVDALDGAPGVHSARYAGPEADPERNRQRLLVALNGRADRRARFRTVLAFADAKGVRFFDGVCEGTITEEPVGEGGFGYDPLFVPDEQPVETMSGQLHSSRTFAEMMTDEKNRISHRGRALDAFVAAMRSGR